MYMDLYLMINDKSIDKYKFTFFDCNKKKSSIKNLIEEFRKEFNKKLIYEQNSNSKKDSLHLTFHKEGLFLNRRKIHKIEYMKYLLKSIFIKI